jgi:insertion element IS1 protein InsB
VALCKKRLRNCGFGEFYDPIARRTIAWVLGRRDDATCQKLLNKIGLEGKTFVTDDWESHHRLIPDDQLFTGKDLTVPIEQDNSNIRHFLARFRRRTKVVSKVVEMVDLSLRIYQHFPDNLDAFAEKPRFSGLSLVRTLFVETYCITDSVESVEQPCSSPHVGWPRLRPFDWIPVHRLRRRSRPVIHIRGPRQRHRDDSTRQCNVYETPKCRHFTLSPDPRGVPVSSPPCATIVEALRGAKLMLGNGAVSVWIADATANWLCPPRLRLDSFQLATVGEPRSTPAPPLPS